MRITVTGGTGFVGRRLVRHLQADNHSVHLLVRRGRTGLSQNVEWSVWEAMDAGPPAESLARADAIVHLSGEPIAQRWTPAAKQRILSSRAEGTRRLVRALEPLPRKPAVLISASAIGFYGSRGEEELSESSGPGSGFLPDVCREWEEAAGTAESLGVRVVSLRIGVVLGIEGGILAKIAPLFRLGAGGRLGAGNQWMSWIHIDDLSRLIRFALVNPHVRGPVNATAPSPVTNREFTQTLASVLRRPAVLPVPAFAIASLFGEMAEVMLGGQRVLPRAAEAAGFGFHYPTLRLALEHLFA